MPLIQWSENLSVGVEKFDSQHKKLISLINELHDAMKAGKGHLVLHNTLEELTSYTQTHFADEERIMKLYNYPGYNAQKIQHDKFIEELHSLQQKIETNPLSLTIDVMNFLKSWLTNHIQKTDKAYSSFFESKHIL